MTMPSIEVARKDQLRPGQPTPGIRREKAFEGPGVLVSRSNRSGGGRLGLAPPRCERPLWVSHIGTPAAGVWRRGEGEEAVDLSPGDFFHIPPKLMHRDVNLSKGAELRVANILVGAGPALVNVEGPVGKRARP
jgi:hypothetical protein